LLATAVTLAPFSAYCAGYELLEQSGKGVGTAFAGSATGFGDASEVFYNPAALTKLDSNTASTSIHLILPHGEFNNKDSKLAPELGDQHLEGNQGGDAGDLNVVPNLYASYQYSDELILGLGINSPFGLSSNYNDTWVGRYHAVESSLTTVNINPGFGLKLGEMFSLGASMQAVHADAKISNAVDFGTIGVSTLGLPTASKLGLLPQQADGFAKVEASDWGFGMGLGSTFSPCEDLTFGINWRSRIHLDLDGNADFSIPTNATILNSTGLFDSSNTTTALNLPESINFGLATKMGPEWTILSDASWIRWDRFEELRVNFASDLPDSVQRESWGNTWRFSLGGKYAPSESWTFKAGFTYDQTPIQSSDFRTARIPDNDRYWAAWGIDYALTKQTSIGFSYAHIFVADADTNITNNTGATLNGSWDLSVEIASVNITSHF
jgi:long-chain fatty acid transport protein